MKTDVWLPAKRDAGLALVARLKPGVGIAQARTEMALLYRFTIAERAAASTDPQVQQLSVEVEPAGAGLSMVRDRIGQPILVLMAVVGTLLLFACMNVAGMLLARGAARAREMTLRLGLGAGRRRLARQVMTESLLLSFAGTAGGALIAYALNPVLLRMIASVKGPRSLQFEVELDWNILLFTGAIAIVTGVLFGLMPALRAFRSDPSLALRQSGNAVETRWGRLMTRGLLSALVALSVSLLSSAGLFLGHLADLRSTDLGFSRNHVFLVTVDGASSGYSPQLLSMAYQQILERVQTIPGVRSASMSAPTPLAGGGASGFGSVEGFEERPESRKWISLSWVAPRYFATLSIPLIAGREFTLRDQSNPRIAILNRTLANYYFPGGNPIGQRITLDHVTGATAPLTYEIVGVAGDSNYAEIREAERRSIYLPAFRSQRVVGNTFLIHSNVDTGSISEDVRKTVKAIAASIPIGKITTLEEQVDATIVSVRMMAMLSGYFAVLGVLLAGIGVYGLLAYTVARRRNEIGIRIALGGTPAAILQMVMQEALLIVGAGLLLGIPLVVWGRSVAATLIENLSMSMVTGYGGAALMLVIVGVVASYVPALRAARVDPIESLRQE